MLGVFRRITKSAHNHRYVLAAFLLPFTIRAIPEILVGPYSVGWDNIAFYVPNTLDIAGGRVDSASLLGIAPLIYLISVPLYFATRLNPVFIFKIMGPILYGLMISALYKFLNTGLQWEERKSVGAAFFTSLYFVTLRIGWDLYRNMLGLTFILLSLNLLQTEKDGLKNLALSLLLALAILSDQLTGAIALALVGIRFLTSLVRGRRRELIQTVRIGVGPVALFSSIVIAGLSSGLVLVEKQPVIPSYAELTNSFGFLIYAILPIFPFAVIGMRRLGHQGLRVWTWYCLGMIPIALLPFYGPSVPAYRWILLADLPLCIYATVGLSYLSNLTLCATKLTRKLFHKSFYLVPALFVVLATAFIALPAQQAFAYYTTFPGFVPTSMLQSNVPQSDMQALATALTWVSANINPQVVIIAHQAIYGWVRAYLPPGLTVINYVYASPTQGVALARGAGYSTIWTIWWKPGLGWDGERFLPNGFVPIFETGNMAVYSYRSTWTLSV